MTSKRSPGSENRAETPGSHRSRKQSYAPLSGSAPEKVDAGTSGKTLGESEDTYRLLVQTSPDAIAATDERGRIAYVNPAWTTMFGVSAFACRRTYLARYITLDSVRKVDELLRACTHGLVVRKVELEAVHRDKHVFPIEISASPILEDGQCRGIECVVRDITERKKNEEALRILSGHIQGEAGESELQALGLHALTEDLKASNKALEESELRLRRILEANPQGVVLGDTRGRVVEANDAFLRIIGLDRKDLEAGQIFWDRITPEEYLSRDVQAIAEAQAMGVSATYEKEYVRPDGGRVPVLMAWATVGGRGQLAAFVLDITKRKRAEEALRESEQRLALALSGTRIGLYDRDMITGAVRGTEQIARLLGLRPPPPPPPPTTTTTTLSQAYDYHDWAERVHPEDWPRVDEEMRRYMVADVPYELEYRILWPDGSVHWLADRGIFHRGPDGRPAHLLGVAMDITERKRAEDALRDLNATLESKVAQRTAELRRRAKQLQKMTLDMSEAEDRERQRLAEILHDDLQQVLAAAKFHLSLIRGEIRNNPALHETGEQIDQMLRDAIAKSRSLSHELSPAVLHHGDFRETLEWLANQVQAKHGLVVHVHTHEQIGLKSDATRAFLYKVARELLFNVVKHAQVAEARIRVRRLGRRVFLSVSDRGRGFDVQQLGWTPGFGLLSIRERIELLGGCMKVKSAAGKGSTFLIVVPDGEAESEAHSPAQGEDTGRLRVLLADDHEIVRDGLASLLAEESDVEVVAGASNGREAVDLAGRLEPDVVIMDVSMPLMSGDEATREIKQRLPGTRVVALSMSEDPDVVERMHQAGAEAYVLKTAPSEELLAAIRGT